MKKYYIYLDGKEHGPFSVDELYDQPMNRFTPVWTGAGAWVPAHQVSDLREVLATKPAPQNLRAASYSTTGDFNGQTPVAAEEPSKKTIALNNKRKILIGLSLLVALAAGAGIYYMERPPRIAGTSEVRKPASTAGTGSSILKNSPGNVQKQGSAQTPAIAAVPTEVEAEKALQERNKAFLLEARQKEVAQEELLKQRNDELQALRAELEQVRARHDAAQAELAQLKRSGFPGSGSRRRAQFVKQQSLVKSLDNRAGSLEAKMEKSRNEIDALSGGGK
jgi:hypothetical protein